MKELIASGEIGTPLFIESNRANLGIFQPDVSVLYDLAVHDLSILDFCFPDQKINSISCKLENPINHVTDSVANLNIRYLNGFSANITCNWLSPIKIRRLLIVGTKAALLYDDTQSIEKLKIYNQEITTNFSNKTDRIEKLISYRTGDIVVPKLSPLEPLQRAVNYFHDCIINDTPGKNELVNQIQIMEQLEIASISANNSGNLIFWEMKND